MLLWNQRISLQSTVRQRSHSYTCTYLVIQHKRCTHTLGNRTQASHTKCHTAYVALSVNVRGRFRLVVAVFGVVWYLLVPHPPPPEIGRHRPIFVSSPVVLRTSLASSRRDAQLHPRLFGSCFQERACRTRPERQTDRKTRCGILVCILQIGLPYCVLEAVLVTSHS